MKCPACSSELSEMQAADLKVDVCKSGCGGVWFDYKEIKQFDEESEIAAESFVNLPKKAGLTINPAPRSCPRCRDAILVQQFFDPKSQVQIDLCWDCGGVWLDTGELAAIRKQFKTEADRQKAGDTFAKQILSQHVAAMKRATREDIAKLEADYPNRLQALISSFKNLLR